MLLYSKLNAVNQGMPVVVVIVVVVVFFLCPR